MKSCCLLFGAILSSAWGAAFPSPYLPDVTQSWLWGESPPDFEKESIFDERPLAWRYPDHGFIQLTAVADRIAISLVKRPPARFFPAGEKFCSSLLPAAFFEFVTSNEIDPVLIKVVSVTIDAHPYKAACKCYMRTLIGMGMNRIGLGSGVVLQDHQVEEFCDYEHVLVEGRPVGDSATAPAVNATALTLLRAAPFIIRDLF